MFLCVAMCFLSGFIQERKKGEMKKAKGSETITAVAWRGMENVKRVVLDIAVLMAASLSHHDRYG